MKYFWLLATVVIVLGACSTPEKPDEKGAESAKTYTRITIAGEKATAEERAACEAVGGKIQKAGMLEYEHCIQTMADGGEVCSDSSECQSKCIIPPQEGREYYPGEAVTGQCAMTDNIFGCYARVTDGKAEPTLCVD